MFNDMDNNRVYQKILWFTQIRHPVFVKYLKRAKDMEFEGRAAYFIAYYMMKDDERRLEKWTITNNLKSHGYDEKTIEKWFKQYNAPLSDFEDDDLVNACNDAGIEADINDGILTKIISDSGFEWYHKNSLDGLFGDTSNRNKGRDQL